MIRLTALLICLAAPAKAELHIAELYAGILACEDATCVGGAASLCMEIEADGDTTRGMMSCTLKERDVWQDLLDQAYADALAFVGAMDADDRAVTPEYAVRLAQLQKAQRSWIAYRDAHCTFEYVIWGAGTIRQLAASSCLLNLTAARTFDLRSYPQMFP